MTNLRLIIFDCDGVLVDSEPVANRIFTEHINRLGLTWTIDETVARMVGRSMASCAAILTAELGRPLPPGFIDAVQADTFARFQREGVAAIPGIPALLDRLDQVGLAYCVASSGGHDKMALTLGSAGLWSRLAGRIYSASEVSRGKPFPDLFLHAAALMGFTPDEALVIEDSLPGVEAACAAGMAVIGYVADKDPTPYRKLTPLIATRMDEVPRLLGLA